MVIVYKEKYKSPILSYAVREFQSKAGIVITASHNSKEYNGYKVYGEDGGQVTIKIKE
jgi:phosphoglucomutase